MKLQQKCDSSNVKKHAGSINISPLNWIYTYMNTVQHNKNKMILQKFQEYYIYTYP